MARPSGGSFRAGKNISSRIREMIANGDPIYVRNNTSVASEIVILCPSPSGRNETAIVPNTKLPIDLTDQVSHVSLGESTDLRNLINNKALILLDPEEGNAILSRRSAQEELEEIWTRPSVRQVLDGVTRGDGTTGGGQTSVQRSRNRIAELSSGSKMSGVQKALGVNLQETYDLGDDNSAGAADQNVDSAIVATVARLETEDISPSLALNQIKRHNFANPQIRRQTLAWAINRISDAYPEILKYLSDELQGRNKTRIVKAATKDGIPVEFAPPTKARKKKKKSKVAASEPTTTEKKAVKKSAEKGKTKRTKELFTQDTQSRLKSIDKKIPASVRKAVPALMLGEDE